MVDSGNTQKAVDRAARQAVSLRRNLVRRKSQERSRRTVDDAPGESGNETGEEKPADGS
jgi:hypothetical protein